MSMCMILLTCCYCCRYGYGSAEFYQQILNGYGNASIPLETFVSDSQYMNHDEDFTLGDKFPLSDMKVSHKSFITRMHS